MDGRLSVIKHLFPVETLSPDIYLTLLCMNGRSLVSNKTFISCWNFVTWHFTLVCIDGRSFGINITFISCWTIYYLDLYWLAVQWHQYNLYFLFSLCHLKFLRCSVLMDGPLSPIKLLFPVEPLTSEIFPFSLLMNGPLSPIDHLFPVEHFITLICIDWRSKGTNITFISYSAFVIWNFYVAPYWWTVLCHQ